MDLGAFSISLSVKDIAKSKEFYEKLGFTVFDGDITQNWLIMKNGHRIIGLFKGMFDGHILTFNPGWDQDAKPLANFTDIREMEKDYAEKGIDFDTKTEGESGPASFIVYDPDGNMIMFDQHV